MAQFWKSPVRPQHKIKLKNNKSKTLNVNSHCQLLNLNLDGGLLNLDLYHNGRGLDAEGTVDWSQLQIVVTVNSLGSSCCVLKMRNGDGSVKIHGLARRNREFKGRLANLGVLGDVLIIGLSDQLLLDTNAKSLNVKLTATVIGPKRELELLTHGHEISGKAEVQSDGSLGGQAERGNHVVDAVAHRAAVLDGAIESEFSTRARVVKETSVTDILALNTVEQTDFSLLEKENTHIDGLNSRRDIVLGWNSELERVLGGASRNSDARNENLVVRVKVLFAIMGDIRVAALVKTMLGHGGLSSTPQYGLNGAVSFGLGGVNGNEALDNITRSVERLGINRNRHGDHL